MDDLAIYRAWKPLPKVERNHAFERDLVAFWETGNRASLAGHGLAECTLEALEAARVVSQENLQDNKPALLFQYAFQSFPEPVLIVGQNGLLPNAALDALLVYDDRRQLRYPVGTRISAMAPVIRAVESAPKIHRASMIVPIGNHAFSTRIVQVPNVQATLAFFRRVPLPMPDASPEALLVLLLRFSGFRAKEIAYLIARPLHFVNKLARTQASDFEQLQSFVGRELRS